MKKKFDNQAQYIKYKVLKEVLRSKINGTLTNDLLTIPTKIIRGPVAETRCCIYKERAIISDRINDVVNTSKDDVINVIDLACDECPLYRFSVTEACRGCLAHHCRENCPVGAIEMRNKKAYINQEKCIECGKCRDVCPYEAIADVKRPCKTACKSNAINFDSDTKKAVIDYDKCIDCGACLTRCPFGAIADKSRAIEVMNLLNESENNTKFNVYAVVAPAISAQYMDAKIENIVTAIKELGFHKVVEAAVGADIVADYEARLLEKELGHVSFVTSSCCPAFVAYIKKKYPELKEHISPAVSPMIATARLIRSTDPTAKVIFIGPCVAKKREITQESLKGDIQYTISFEELLALLDAYKINPSECEPSPLDNATFYGRIFARSGGVTDAIKNSIKELELNVDLKPVICNGLDECDKALKLAKVGKLNGNFIEGMACKGGCINGPLSLFKKTTGNIVVDNNAKLANLIDSADTKSTFDIDSINLDV